MELRNKKGGEVALGTGKYLVGKKTFYIAELFKRWHELM